MKRTTLLHKTSRFPAGICAVLLATLLLAWLPLPAFAETDLPALGDAGTGVISPAMEHRVGAAWLRELRSRTNLLYDPVVADYAEHLAYRIASHSDLVEPRLSLVILNSTEINAFAVPGGIMGINAGLLLSAGSEDEVASVIAHELAHLSQRHFARSLDQQRRQQPLALTALLASILVAATVGGDVGTAAIIGTQAGLMQNQLAYSREHEREADRIGMQTLARAGFDPAAMPAFFEKLLRAAPIDPDRYPEYIRTHPITESRISDSRNRARQLPVPAAGRDSLDFDLTRARLQVAFARDGGEAAARFGEALRQAPPAQQVPLRYGLALALLRANRYDDALAALAPLRANAPERIAYRVTEGEILLAADRTKDAEELLTAGLALAPDNFPLTMTAALALIREKHASKAVALLERQALLRRDDPQVWQLLARARGETGDTVGVHAARAEYLFLVNQADPAKEQLELGIRKAGDDFARAAPLHDRLREMDETRHDFKL